MDAGTGLRLRTRGLGNRAGTGLSSRTGGRMSTPNDRGASAADMTIPTPLQQSTGLVITIALASGSISIPITGTYAETELRRYLHGDGSISIPALELVAETELRRYLSGSGSVPVPAVGMEAETELRRYRIGSGDVDIAVVLCHGTATADHGSEPQDRFGSGNPALQQTILYGVGYIYRSDGDRGEQIQIDAVLDFTISIAGQLELSET